MAHHLFKTMRKRIRTFKTPVPLTITRPNSRVRTPDVKEDPPPPIVVPRLPSLDDLGPPIVVPPLTSPDYVVESLAMDVDLTLSPLTDHTILDPFNPEALFDSFIPDSPFDAIDFDLI